MKAQNEKPILFSTPMIQAILEGRKTQTRRIVKFPKDWDGKRIFSNGILGLKYGVIDDAGNELLFRLFSKYEIGNTLWVRETWTWEGETKFTDLQPIGNFWYKADFEKGEGPSKWKPSIFMPYEACRIKLKITDIRVERLQDISEDDAIAEGIENKDGHYLDYISGNFCRKPKQSYQMLWAKINGIESWVINPWVWVISFLKMD